MPGYDTKRDNNEHYPASHQRIVEPIFGTTPVLKFLQSLALDLIPIHLPSIFPRKF